MDVSDTSLSQMDNINYVNNNDKINTPDKKRVIKFTKIPSNTSLLNEIWSTHNTRMSNPRLRRTVTIDEGPVNTSRSIKVHTNQRSAPHKFNTSKKTVLEREGPLDEKLFIDRDVASINTRTNRAVQADKNSNIVIVCKINDVQSKVASSSATGKLNNSNISKGSKINAKKVDNDGPVVQRNKDNIRNLSCNRKGKAKIEKKPIDSSNKSLTKGEIVDQRLNMIKNKLIEEEKPRRIAITYPSAKYNQKPINVLRVPNNENKIKGIRCDRASNTDPVPQSQDASMLTELDVKNKGTFIDAGLEDDIESLNVPDLSLVKVDRPELLYGQSLPDLRVPQASVKTNKVSFDEAPNFDHIRYSEQQTNYVMNNHNYPLTLMSLIKADFESPKNGSLTDLELSSNYNLLSKPSDIIKKMKINSIITKEHTTEQFNKELSFIDTFFDSLKHLENCYMAKNVDSTGKLVADDVETGSSHEIFCDDDKVGQFEIDPGTIASKSLYLLNLLIMDENRRAKNLLFVLKLREDALKDFTKSQILWVENKKRHQDPAGTTNLKKKQRGAMMRLQQECEEMQKMRKTILVLSEKRKSVLISTKKNIESKINNVSISQKTQEIKAIERIDSVQSVEKAVQASDPNIVEEDLVSVHGAFLNIVFENLNMPQMFCADQQYAVNKRELDAMVTASNAKVDLNYNELVNRLSQLLDSEKSNPSTARSLLEEMTQFYEYLDDNNDLSEGFNLTQSEENLIHAGPLPVPAGAPQDHLSDTNTWSQMTLCNSSCGPTKFVDAETDNMAVQNNQPTDCEAELLDIERKIKELEQEQSMLVAREIPNKPPPPYTPPTECKVQRSKRRFLPDSETNMRIYKTVCGEENESCEDAFDMFVEDFVIEAMKRNEVKKSDEPWDASNLLPQKTEADRKKVWDKIVGEVEDILTCIPSACGAGMDDIVFVECNKNESEWTSLHSSEPEMKNKLFENIFQKLLDETITCYKDLFKNKNAKV